MDSQQWDFACFISREKAVVQLKDLLWDMAVLTDPHEKRLVMEDPPDDFLVVRWQMNSPEYYGGRPVLMRGCCPFIIQVWVGDGRYAYPESDVLCLFFDDPDYNDYWNGGAS